MVDDFSMSYIDSAEMTTILLIHGFPLSSALWWPQIEELEDMVRIIAPDLRGLGDSDATPPPYTIEMYAEDCVSLLDTLGIDEPVIVGGLSMGGYVALALYREYPERVGGLILTATRAAADSADGRVNRDRAIAQVEAEGIEPLVTGLLPRLLAPDTVAEEPALVAYVEEMMRGSKPDGVIGALMAMRDRADSTELLSRIDVPVLILHGQQDQIVPLAEAEAMAAAIPDARLFPLEAAGHLPNLERADVWNMAVAQFVATLQASGTR